jgi:hypothetical protein
VAAPGIQHGRTSAEVFDHGYVEGQNIILEFRFAQGRPELLPSMASEVLGKAIHC